MRTETFSGGFVRTVSLCSAFVLGLSGTGLANAPKQEELLRDAAAVIKEFQNSPDSHVPNNMMSAAKGIIIFPTMIKGGFFFGARYGKGVASVRDPKTGEWSAPAFLYTGGGSFGLQIGAQAVDLILLVMSHRGVEGLLEDQFTLGADIAVSVGPVGRHAEAAADIFMQGEIYSYSRSRGAFAGISFKGTVITSDEDSNHIYYGKQTPPEVILLHRKAPRQPASATAFMNVLNTLAPYKKRQWERRKGFSTEPSKVPVSKKPEPNPAKKPPESLARKEMKTPVAAKTLAPTVTQTNAPIAQEAAGPSAKPNRTLVVKPSEEVADKNGSR